MTKLIPIKIRRIRMSMAYSNALRKIVKTVNLGSRSGSSVIRKLNRRLAKKYHLERDLL